MSNNEETKVTVEDDMPEMEDVPELEAQPTQESAEPEAKTARRTSKMEKKNKKALLKSGLKEFPGVEKVTIQTAGKINLAIDQPDVFRSQDTYVIFGQPRIEDAKSQQTKDVLQNILQQQDLSSQISDLEKQTSADESADTEDAEGLQEKDIEVVMKEASTDRASAIKALKAHKGDVVDAVVSLTGQ